MSPTPSTGWMPPFGASPSVARGTATADPVAPWSAADRRLEPIALPPLPVTFELSAALRAQRRLDARRYGVLAGVGVGGAAVFFALAATSRQPSLVVFALLVGFALLGSGLLRVLQIYWPGSVRSVTITGEAIVLTRSRRAPIRIARLDPEAGFAVAELGRSPEWVFRRGDPRSAQRWWLWTRGPAAAFTAMPEPLARAVRQWAAAASFSAEEVPARIYTRIGGIVQLDTVVAAAPLSPGGWKEPNGTLTQFGRGARTT